MNNRGIGAGFNSRVNAEAIDTRDSTPTKPILKVDGLTVRFGALRACDDVNLEVNQGTIVGLIGPNGSGKTTLMRAISGRIRASQGVVWWSGQNISGWPVDRVAQAGLIGTSQDENVFPGVSVAESVRMSAECKRGGWRGRDGLARYGGVTGLLELLGLTDVARRMVGTLSTGHIRKIGIASALAAGPLMLLLDEPAAGLNDDETAGLRDTLGHLRRLGMTMLLVDHDMGFVLPLCDRIAVLDAGRNFAEGEPAVVARDERVIEIYIGSASPTARSDNQLKPIVRGRSQGEASPEGATQAPGLALSIVGLTGGYGPAPVIHDVSLNVERSEIVALIGPNGAGKTSLLRAITGDLRIHAGTIKFEGETISGLRTDMVLRRGIAHVLQGRQLFAEMTVMENLELGAIARGSARRQVNLETILGAFPVLREKSMQRAGLLSGGQQQMLVIARAVMSEPKVLLLDEPSLGLAPLMLPVIVEIIEWIRATFGTSVLLVEQHTGLARELSSRCYVMAAGRVVKFGPTADLFASEDIHKSYFGASTESN